MNSAPKIRTITEPAREIEICREADVVVVGGGPGGIGSALAAARSGVSPPRIPILEETLITLPPPEDMM